ncbi:uncharacterized protein LOC129216672 [Uloborus diversus]|uniref:uncharacterized protein LOC129216672 n=1 Tax=Uloborus diversus TaxID=327109 RepID=UPI0024097DB9|nr:uncharacterized protein LOC129216672 [Uloborus diversus]
MPTPYEKEMEHLRSLLAEVESDEESIDEENAVDNFLEEHFSDHENFSEHDTESEEDGDSENEELNNSEWFFAKDGVKWKKTKFRQNVRTRCFNIVSHLPGTKGLAKNVTNPLNSWELYIDDSMIQIIVECTNIFIEKCAPNFSRDRDARKTDALEIRALLGLLYMCGLHKTSRLNVRDLWATDGTGVSIFRTTMSYKRFLFLLRCMRFDNIHDRKQRQLYDKLAAIRDFFQSFVTNCQKYYTLGEYVTIDKKLEPFRGRCGFRQYMPKKPAKYGIKIFALVDARTFYTSNMEVYVGCQPDGPYKVSNSPDDVVKHFMKPLYKSGRNLTTDNWYTSYKLAKDLLSEKITLVGTMRKDKRQIPVDFKMCKGREIHSSIFGFQQDATLVSYVPKKSKCVILLSTMHNDDAIDIDTGDAKKPENITFYNCTKAAVDVVDEMAANYSTARKTNRWPLVIFYSILNVAAINARIALLSNKDPPILYQKRRRFIKDLALSLINDYTNKRMDNPNLSHELREHLQNSCRPESEEPPKKKLKVASKGRCIFCPRNKDIKTTGACNLCANFVCKEHLFSVCNCCLQKSKE